MTDEHQGVRQHAAVALGTMRDRRALVPLAQVLLNTAEPHVVVRTNAAYALMDIHDGRAFEPLVAALNDGNAVVRSAAAYALGQLGDKRAIGPLVDALVADEQINYSIGAALTALADDSTATLLIQVLRNGPGPAQYIAAQVLGNLRLQRGLDPQG